MAVSLLNHGVPATDSLWLGASNALVIPNATPGGADPVKVRVSPVGQAPNYDPRNGEAVIQLVDQAAHEAMQLDLINRANAGETEMLVDIDHNAYYGISTHAEGWLQCATAEVRADGLYAVIDWCVDSGGKTVLNRKNFKFLSPEYPIASIQDVSPGVLRPTTLTGLSVTNKPNFTQLKFQNSASPNPTKMNITAILTLLGLSATASETDLLNAVQGLKAKADKLPETETQLLNARKELAEEFLTRHAGVIANRVTIKAQIESMLNAGKKTEAETLIAELTPPKPVAPARPALHNAAAATPPSNPLDDEAKKEKRSAALRNAKAELPDGATNHEIWTRAMRLDAAAFSA